MDVCASGKASLRLDRAASSGCAPKGGNRSERWSGPPAQIVLQNLLEQMRTHMNRYFLIIATLQLFSALTPVCAAAGARGRFNRECV